MLGRLFAALVTALAVAAVLPAEAQQSTLAKVKQAGVMKVGVRRDVPYFGFVNDQGEIVGFEIDLARELAKRLGVKAELVPVTSATRIPLLEQGRIDAIIATLSHYRKRDEVIDFSIGYFNSPTTLLVKKDSGIRSLEDMQGKRAGTTVGAGAAENYKKAVPNGDVQTFEGYPETFLALQQGLVDAVVTDVMILASLKASAPHPDDYVILGDKAHITNGEYAVGMRENDSKWRDAINFALQDIWSDGTWDKIFDKWLGPGTKLGLRKDDIGFKMTVWD